MNIYSLMGQFRKFSVNRFHILILFALPLLITLINPNWIYNPTVLNSVDTWIYNGLFRYFFDFADKHPSNIHYFVERVSWVMPGYFFYHVFNAILANALIHLSVFYACVFSIYGIAQRLFGKDTAFITALCLGCYTWFLRAAGHDYIDGPGIAYFSVALWFVTEAVYRKRFGLFLAGGGAFFALSILTQLFMGIFLPIIGIYYLLLNWGQNRHSILLGIMWGALGGISVSLGFMIFNYLTVGEFNIFNDSLNFITTKSHVMQDDIYADMLRLYLPTPPTWLILPAGLSLWVIGCFLRWKTIPQAQRFLLRTITIIFVLVMGIFIYFHYSSPYMMLRMYIYTSLIIPIIFLLLAALIATLSPIITARMGWLLLGIVLIPFLFPISFKAVEALLLQPSPVWLITACMLIAMTLVIVGRAKITVFVAAFSVMSLMFSGHNGIAVHDRLYTYHIFTSAMDTLALIDAQDPEPLDFSEYMVWEDAPNFVLYTKPIRRMSQPIYGHSPNWTTNSRRRLIVRLAYQPVQNVLLLSENDTVIEDIQRELGAFFEIEVRHSFDILSIDPTGQYRGYLLLLTQLEQPE